MPRVKLIVAVLILYAALGAVSASSAPAAEWFVGGTKLGAGKSAEVALTATADETTTFNAPSIKTSLTCTGPLLLRLGVIHNQNTYLSEEHVWQSCSVSQPTTCSLASHEIDTEPIVGVLTTSIGVQDRVTFSAKTGKTITVLTFVGGACPLAGDIPIQGSFTQKLPTGQTELTSQAFEGLGTIENNSLELGLSKIYLENGKALVKLASGSKWGFH